MPFLSARHARLDYDVTGDGATVVQLHGLTSSRMRDAQLGLDLCRGLSGHRVIRYDARGHGRSTGRGVPDDYTWPHLADDLLHLLDQVAPFQQVCGVGQSMGAATLLHAACSDPGRFRALVVGIPPTAWSTRVAQQATYLDTADVVEERGIEELMVSARTAPRPPAVGPDVPTTVPDVETALLPAVFRGAARSDLPSLGAITDLQVPTLLLCWVQDPAHPVSTAKRLSQLLPQHHLAVAHTPADVARWPALVADHLAACA